MKKLRTKKVVLTGSQYLEQLIYLDKLVDSLDQSLECNKLDKYIFGAFMFLAGLILGIFL